MKTVATVFKKELIDTIRDRRTLLFMIVIPLLLFPVLFKIMFSLQEKQTKKAEQKVLRVALVDNDNAARFAAILNEREGLSVSHDVPADSILFFIQDDRREMTRIDIGKFAGSFIELSIKE